MTTVGDHVAAKLTFTKLCVRRDEILATALDKASKSPVRGGYSRLIGGYIQTKNDIMKAAIADLKNLNMVAQALHGKDVWNFEEEEVEIKGKPAS